MNTAYRYNWSGHYQDLENCESSSQVRFLMNSVYLLARDTSLFLVNLSDTLEDLRNSGWPLLACFLEDAMAKYDRLLADENGSPYLSDYSF